MEQEDLKSVELAVYNKSKLLKKFKKLKKTNSKLLDEFFHRNHFSEFQKMNCLTCANCCKTTSPIFKESDIKRISNKLKLKQLEFINLYLKMDDENDYVLKSSPCIFLNENNECWIYEFRPNACREYPHTDRKKINQILDITLENSIICPVVARITQKIDDIL